MPTVAFNVSSFRSHLARDSSCVTTDPTNLPFALAYHSSGESRRARSPSKSGYDLFHSCFFSLRAQLTLRSHPALVALP